MIDDKDINKKTEEFPAVQEVLSGVKKETIEKGGIERERERGAEKKFEVADKERILVEIEKVEGESSKELVSDSGGVLIQQKRRQKEVEKVLAAGLEKIYTGLPVDKQKDFKLAGERTSYEISKLLAKTKISLKKIISLIKEWLSMIPGVNKYFLEQEAKIKADEIMKIKN